jgi:hypothetical protein
MWLDEFKESMGKWYFRVMVFFLMPYLMSKYYLNKDAQ